MNILQVNVTDITGGAARIAWYLFQKCGQRGHGSYFAVGRKTGNDSNTFEIPNYACRNLWAGTWSRLEKKFTKHNIRYLRGLARRLAIMGERRRWADRQKGIEDFNYPGTHHLLGLLHQHVDILHAHVLHSDYFNLKLLPEFTRRVPTVITLHDEWMMTGHCACTIGCERWKVGCGQCPDLTTYPPVKRDATAYNWFRKRKIYAKSRFYIATPSNWLMKKTKCSILNNAVIDSRVIPNGVDLSVFRPVAGQAARRTLNLPQDAWIMLFVAAGGHNNRFKDFATIKKAFLKFSAGSVRQKAILICLGGKGNDQRIGSNLIHFPDYVFDIKKVSLYYSASDLYIHGTRTDNFPNSILEALACGTPVIATRVGGIPEQIDEGVTGFLVPPHDSGAMASRIKQLQENKGLWQKMSAMASDSARKHFDLDRMADEYLSWYQEILKNKLRGDG
ncbi:glycosyl transferase [Desulfonema ishimotonii]|uniref:Glycosyl transferase n=1 Tax=Desulfonema ishimotonii TaxID=45657 RepID=A0A401G3E0_9BACT|nr:glycosyltransferase [Desulfonema ishimotonii]GBC63750.1 glycosyl transferase [Desulfonema ishimotonii]